MSFLALHAGAWQLEQASEVWVLAPGEEPRWDETSVASIYAAKKPLTAAADVKAALGLALEVIKRDPAATVDPVPERLRVQHGLMDWAQVGRRV